MQFSLIRGVQFNEWNCEIIWGYWPRYQNLYYNIACFNRHFAMPPLITKMGCGQYCPSLKLVDSYPMAATGRYPIDPVTDLGYDSNGMPVVDPKSGYADNGFESGWEHPIEGPKYGAVKAHKSCVGRDARFYASVFANGFKFINDFIAGGNTEVYFQTGGNSPLRAGDCQGRIFSGAASSRQISTMKMATGVHISGSTTALRRFISTMPRLATRNQTARPRKPWIMSIRCVRASA